MEMFWAVLLCLFIIVFLIALVVLAVMAIDIAIRDFVDKMGGQSNKK